MDAGKIVVDGKNGQDLLVADMKDAGIRKKPVLPKVDDIVLANSAFEEKLFPEIP